MNNKFLRRMFSGCLACLLFACNDNKQGSGEMTMADKEQIKQEIQAKEDQFAAIYNTGELKDIGYYANDAISFYQGREPLAGKQAIIEFLKSDLAANTNKISFRTSEIFVSNDGNQVVEIGYFKVVDSASNPVNSGNYMSLFVKRDGKYVSLRDMSASDMPPK